MTFIPAEIRMGKIFRLLQYANMLSLDIVAGAVISSAFFAKLLAVSILPFGYITLGLTVWIIYTADHLLDVWKNPKPASTERHRLHQQYFNVLGVILVLALIIVGIEVNFIRQSVLIGGIQLSILVAIYFIAQKHLKFLKEIAAAILYTGGVLIAPFSLLDGGLSPGQLIIVVQFFLTALANLLMFSLFDLKNDFEDSHPSIAISWGESTTMILLTVVFLIHAGLSVMYFTVYPGSLSAGSVILGMNVVLILMVLKRNYFTIDDRYRVIGDGVFLLPSIFILFG